MIKKISWPEAPKGSRVLDNRKQHVHHSLKEEEVGDHPGVLCLSVCLSEGLCPARTDSVQGPPRRCDESGPH